MSNKPSGLFLCFILIFIGGCSSTKLDRYVSPTFGPGMVEKVAIMPIQNQSINAGQAIELNRSFILAAHRKNPRIEFVAGQEASNRLNDQNLVDAWTSFLSGYATSGLPNARTLERVGNALEVDAIVVGSIVSIRQQDSDGVNYPITQVSVRYTMFSARDGSVMWEVTGEGKDRPYSYSATPIFEVARMAHEKILEALPF